MNNQTRGIIYTLITVFMWGVLAVALKVAVRIVDSPTIVWFRFSLAFSGMFLWMLIKNPKELRILYRPSWLLVISTLALAANYITYMLGVAYTSPSNAQVVAQAGPIILTIFSVIFFKEKITWVQGLGFALAAFGFWLFYSRHLHAANIPENRYVLGMLITFIGAVVWAVYAAMQKKLVLQYEVGTLNVFIFGLPVLLYLPLANFSSLTHLSLGYWLLLIFLGANTLISYGCLSLALKYLEAGKVSILLILNPIITFVFMGILTWLQVDWIEGEHFSVLSVLGALTVLAGSILVVRKRKRKGAN